MEQTADNWKMETGRLGVFRSVDGTFSGTDGRTECGKEIILFENFFPKPPKLITTNIIIGNPKTKKQFVCNALWDTGCTDSAVDSNIVESLDLELYGQKEMSDFSTVRTCNFFLADIKPENKHFYFNNEIVCSCSIQNEIYSAIIGMDIIKYGTFKLEKQTGGYRFTFSARPKEKKKLLYFF